MVIQSLLGRLLKFDFNALEELETLRTQDEHECAETAWAFLTRAGEDGRHVPGGFCTRATKLFLGINGRETGEAFILQNWSRLSDQAKENVCYDVLADPYTLSTEFALHALRSSHSKLADKLNIISNLALTRDDRRIGTRGIIDLLSDLVANAEPNERDRVSAFAEKIKADW